MTSDVPAPDGQSLPPQGWYADPAGSPNTQRWWDGRSWTEHLRQVSPPPSFQPTVAYVPTGPTTGDGVPLASWGRRVLATILDSFLLSMAASVLLVLVNPAFVERVGADMESWLQGLRGLTDPTQVPPPPLTELDLGLMTAVQAGATLAYGILMLHFVGATIGQLALGIRVTPTDQGRRQGGLPWLTAVLRSAAWTVLASGYSLIALVQVVSVLLPLFSAKRQTIPDLLARTQVVRQDRRS